VQKAGAPQPVGSAHRVLRRRRYAVDRDEMDRRRGRGAARGGRHPDGGTERADRLQGLVELEHLARVLVVRGLAAEEIGLKAGPRRGIRFTDEDLDLLVLPAEL